MEETLQLDTTILNYVKMSMEDT